VRVKAILLGTAAAAAISTVAAAQGQSIKIGFVSTFSGPTAVIGNDMRNAFELALDHLGRKMDGLPVEVIYEDDGQKPDIGRQKSEKLVQSDKVDFVVGYIWSNVLLASLKPVVDSKTFLISAMRDHPKSRANSALRSFLRPLGKTIRRRQRSANT
jgi:branched-chain amino acid transport system substrate-binding protein